MTLEEFMQQQATQRGYTKSPLRYVYEGFDGGQEEIDQNRVDFQQLLPILKRIDPMYGAMEDYQVGEADAPSYAQRFVNREQELKNAYYADPSNFVQTRATPIAKGVNTFNEGNADQKAILDQINTGKLKIVPVNYEFQGGFQEEQGQPKEIISGYELKDSSTGQTIQRVTPIDAEKGIFNIFADDKNSSGFFNNYVSTDPSGFVNPIVSEQQSQYQSRPNSSANFYKNAALAALSMTGLAVPGLGEAIGAATGLGTVGSNVALNAGINAIKQAVTGNFDPLALATSAALSYGLGGADGADPLTADDLYTGQAMTDLAASYDATRLDDLINSLSNTGLTSAEIDQLTREAVETGTQFDAYTSPIDTPAIVQPYDAQLIDPTTGEPFGTIEDPLVDNYMDGFTSVSETGLATLPDEGMLVDLPGTTLLGDLGAAGAVETPIPSGGIPVRQLLSAANAASSLLGSGQESAAAPATQFRGTRVPSGQVDYSGILGLLQMQSPQRRSLLG